MRALCLTAAVVVTAQLSAGVMPGAEYDDSLIATDEVLKQMDRSFRAGQQEGFEEAQKGAEGTDRTREREVYDLSHPDHEMILRTPRDEHEGGSSPEVLEAPRVPGSTSAGRSTNQDATSYSVSGGYESQVTGGPVDLDAIKAERTIVSFLEGATVERIITALMPSDWVVHFDVETRDAVEAVYVFDSSEPRDRALRTLTADAGLNMIYNADSNPPKLIIYGDEE